MRGITLDVKDGKKVSEFLAEDGRCKADVSWVRRSPAKDGPAKVAAIVIGRCAKLEAREGTYNARGGDAGEPLNLELTFVFLESEQVRPGSAPDEPFTTSVVHKLAAPGELPPCPPRP